MSMSETNFELFCPQFRLSYCALLYSSSFRAKKIAAAEAAAPLSSLTEGLAVGALIHGGVGLVSAYQDLVQRAVIGTVAVISAGLDGALDALVGILIHHHFLLHCGFSNSMAVSQ